MLIATGSMAGNGRTRMGMGTKRLLLSIQPGFRVLLNPGCLAQNHPASFQAKPSAKGRGLRTRSFETLALMVRRPASSFETLALLAPQDEARPRTTLAPQDEALMLRSARSARLEAWIPSSLAEPVIGPAEGRNRWLGPGMTGRSYAFHSGARSCATTSS